MRNHRPSATACLIAGSMYRATHDVRLAVLVSPFAVDWAPHALDAYGPPASWVVRWLNSAILYRLSLMLERALLPGIVLHYMTRKRCIEETLKVALEQGIKQVVILGSGFDTLALRYCEDHQTAQRTAWDRLGRPVPANLSWAPLDLSVGIPALADKQSLIIIEGVLMYLTEPTVRDLIRRLADSVSPGSRLVFTSMAPLADGRVNFKKPSRWVDRWMHWRREPFKWGIAPDRLAEFLKPLGWRLHEWIDEPQLRRCYLAPANLINEPLAVGEYIAVCDSIDKKGGYFK
jgi:O-methyltransferase involved in polyketide biosynthesis